MSGRIGLTQAGLGEVTVGAVFAVALGAGLLGVVCAGILGPRLGGALPIGLGTVLIAGCIALSAAASDLTSFATGEIAWNTLYPVVLSYVIGLAASMDRRGRWAVLVGSASSLGTACGPLTGSLLSARAGYPAMGMVLAAGLLLVTVPMTLVARRPRRSQVVEIPVVEIPLAEIPVVDIPVPETAAVESTAGQVTRADVAGLADLLADSPSAEDPFARLPVVEIPVAGSPLDAVPAPREAYGTAGPRHAGAATAAASAAEGL